MSDTLDYLAVAPCGCIRGWCSVTVPRDHVADFVADQIRWGNEVERVTTEESRTRPWYCPKHKTDRETKQAEMAL